MEGYVLNISRKGARLRLTHGVPPEDAREITLHFPREVGPLRLRCRPAWRAGRDMGVEFLTVDRDPELAQLMRRAANRYGAKTGSPAM